jgi:hypothetical protein
MMLAVSIAYAGIPCDVGLRLLERATPANPRPVELAAQ